MLLIHRNTSLQNQDSEPSLRYSDSLNTDLLILRLDAVLLNVVSIIIKPIGLIFQLMDC